MIFSGSQTASLSLQMAIFLMKSRHLIFTRVSVTRCQIITSVINSRYAYLSWQRPWTLLNSTLKEVRPPLLDPAKTAFVPGLTAVPQIQSVISPIFPSLIPSLFQSVTCLSLPAITKYSPVGQNEIEQGSQPSSLSMPIGFTVLPPLIEQSESFWSQDPAMSKLSLVSNFCGQNLKHQTGLFWHLLITVSSPPFLSLSRILPVQRAMARTWPSGDQSQSRHLALVGNLFTFQPSVYHRPKSLSVHDAKLCSTGLKQRAQTFALCAYFKSPTPSADQTTTLLSAPPDAQRCPSFEQAKA